MRRRVVLAVVVVVTAGACKQAREWSDNKAAEREAAEAVHATEAAPVTVRPNGPGLPAGTYRLIDLLVEAQPTNRKGKAWDDAPGAEPDLQITLRIDGERRHRCTSVENSRFGRCKLDLEVRVDASTQIELEVIDRDSVLDDPIGTATLTDPSSWDAATDLPMMPAGRLRAATIRFARRPTWWELHRGRLVGLGAGVFVALGVAGAFRRSLMPPPPPPLPIPSCAHCHAVLGTDLARCSHCGAVQKGAGA